MARLVAGDIDGALELVHPDVVARSPLPGTGADVEVRAFDYEPAGDCVIVRGYLWQRAGNALAERQVFWLFAFQDGLVVRMESHPTRAAALAASEDGAT